MWLLLSRRLRRWLIVAFALPVARTAVHRAALESAKRNAQSTSSRVLRGADAALARTSRRRGRWR